MIDATRSTAAGSPLRLDARLDPARLAPVFARFRRIHVANILESASATRMHEALRGDVPWQFHYNDGNAVYDCRATDVDRLDAAARARLFAPIHDRARFQFQYCFDNYSISDAHQRGDTLNPALLEIWEFLKSDAVMEFARRVTGVPDIRVVDAQATRYGPGQFLTAHDDKDEGKGRVAAYVLNLTRIWRTEWGGILQFHDADGHVAEGYTPCFNALNLLRVPTIHSVSYVAPFAAGPRFSITGWFRTR